MRAWPTYDSLVHFGASILGLAIMAGFFFGVLVGLGIYDVPYWTLFLGAIAARLFVIFIIGE